MANQAKGERSIQIGDKTYTLFFDMNAIAELEDALNMPMPQIGEIMQDQSRIGVKFIRAALWAGLLHHHADEVPDVQEAGRLLSEAESLADVVKPLGEAFAAAFAKEAEQAKKHQKKVAKK